MRHSKILPPDEGPFKPISWRIPAKLLARVDAIGKMTRLSRQDVLVHFVRWAVEEYEREQAQLDGKDEKGSQGPAK